jgi:2-aminoadipate transaminase
MSSIFSDRIRDVPQSFIREILKVATQSDVISFAGGLPNGDLFPVKEIQQAANKVLEAHGREVLQYANTEGYLPLRQYIVDRYKEKQGLSIGTDNVLITTGSQQGLDLLGKILVNEGDDVVIEAPGYLGAIQAFSVYRPKFSPVAVDEKGLDCEGLKSVMNSSTPKLFYSVPNFQNPSGITYSNENRKKVADIISGTNTLLIEDNPYGDLRFEGEEKKSFYKLMPENTLLLGSFSKTIVPAFRTGWIVAPDHIMEKLVIAKQAADLHSNYFAQRIIHQYLIDNDLDTHIKNIINVYRRQKIAMMDSINRHFPETIKFTHPEGGMFLWAELPEGFSSMDLFEIAIKDKVAFVPGDPFYIDNEKRNTLRLNFSCSNEETIEVGIQRLAKAIKSFIN